jgi:hypothetical protein
MSTPGGDEELGDFETFGAGLGETMRLESMKVAASVASAAERTSLTKPALPRPPAWTWALTTARSVPVDLEAFS